MKSYLPIGKNKLLCHNGIHEKSQKEYTIENLQDQRNVLAQAQVLLHNKFACDDTDVAIIEDDIENAMDYIILAITKIDCKMDELTNTKIVCDNCGDKITLHPHNGRPLINGDVCDTCNHIVQFHKLLIAIDTQNAGMNFQQVCDYLTKKGISQDELGRSYLKK